MKCAGVRSMETGDDDFVEVKLFYFIFFLFFFSNFFNGEKMLKRLVHGRHVLLAFDKHYREDGTVDTTKTNLHTPNEYVWRIAEKYSEVFLPSCSVHPYRKDALEVLDEVFIFDLIIFFFFFP